MFKNFARIVGCGDTFFSGNAEIVCGNKHLDPAFKLNDCEKTESYKNFSSAGRNNKISVKAVGNTFGKIKFASAAVTFTAIRNAA